jgi:hypothetical protein
MHISDHGHAPATAQSPKSPEVLPLEPNDSTLQSAGIEVVVKNRLLDPGCAVRVTTSKEESTTLPYASATGTESSE